MSKDTTVFVLLYTNDFHTEFIGIFSICDKAEKAKNLIIKKYPDYYNRTFFYISEETINKYYGEKV